MNFIIRKFKMPLLTYQFWLALGTYALVLWPCGKLFQIFAKNGLSRTPPASAFGAGRYIGYFERTIIVLLVLRGEFEAIGLLVTAKSIIRIQDAQAKEESEYLIVGTLYSFMCAIIAGEICRWLLKGEL
ncbi:hypothetical protein [Hymenobacter psychrotolerans]|uniref:hypothetical protein n=1 Tax=Hymenobacter psychrotolerans TaxID=344998 RepID=UPI0011148CEC|nr:hypothetical protein [Hymenobacter psychrotolerans]